MSRKRKWIAVDSPREPVTRVACRALENRLTSVWDYLPRAAKHAGEDPEYVHQLRVSSRRAVAAVEIFESYLPERRTAWFKKQLKKVRQAAGEARDFDVLAVRLGKTLEDDASAPARHVLNWIAKCRSDAQPAIRRIYVRLRDRDYERRVAKLLDKTGMSNGEARAEPEFSQAAREAMRQSVDAFFAASHANLADTSKLHLFRISGKQLRYAMEIFAGAFPSSFVEQVYPQVAELQEKLGEINDHVSALAHFQEWLPKFDGDERALLARLAEAEAKMRDDCLTAFFQFWTADRNERLRFQFSRELGDGQIAIRPDSLPVAESG
ncbi:MAG TPA: CHAD domain-containing protein [Pirellulales bacterium]|jgi:CHAD domain-containing protein|nr:CHAD domain-containing protein [Pirellulales bacterium]